MTLKTGLLIALFVLALHLSAHSEPARTILPILGYQLFSASRTQSGPIRNRRLRRDSAFPYSLKVFKKDEMTKLKTAGSAMLFAASLILSIIWEPAETALPMRSD